VKMGWDEICTKEEFREKIYPVCHTVALRLRSPTKEKTKVRTELQKKKCVCLQKPKSLSPEVANQTPLQSPLPPLQRLSQPLAPLATFSQNKKTSVSHSAIPPSPFPLPFPFPFPVRFAPHLQPISSARKRILNSWASLSLMCFWVGGVGMGREGLCGREWGGLCESKRGWWKLRCEWDRMRERERVSGKEGGGCGRMWGNECCWLGGKGWE